MKLKVAGKIRLAATLLALGSALPFGIAQGVMITLEDVTNGGGFFAALSLEDAGVDTVNVTINIADPINVGLTEGDILALFFDIADSTFDTETLAATSFNPGAIEGGVTVFPAGDGTSLGGNANVNGTGFQFDVGIETGQNGRSQGFNQLVMFDLMGTGLSTGTFGQDFGLRVQSIDGTGTDFFAEGSSMLIGNPGPIIPTPNPNPIPTPGTLALLGAGLLGVSFARRASNSATKVV